MVPLVVLPEPLQNHIRVLRVVLHRQPTEQPVLVELEQLVLLQLLRRPFTQLLGDSLRKLFLLGLLEPWDCLLLVLLEAFIRFSPVSKPVPLNSFQFF